MARALTKDTRQRARETFLQALAQRGVVAYAATTCGVSRHTLYEWRLTDAAFADAWEEALETAIDAAEAEAYRRGIEGWDEPVFGRIGKDQDGQVGTMRRYSDAMLALILRGNRRDKYGERLEHIHRGAVNVEYVNDWRSVDTDVIEG